MLQNTISIKANSTFDDVDHYYLELNRYIKQDATVNISLPKDLKKSYFGIVSAIVQFVCTWERYYKSGKLILPISPDASANEIDALYENEFIYPSTILVWNREAVFDKTGNANLRQLLRKKNNEFLLTMKKVKPLKREKLPLVISDHIAGATLPVFETSLDFRNEEEIKESLRPSINDILTYSLAFKEQHEKVLDDIKTITFELVKNTFEWGRTDNDNVSLDPSIRGVFFKFFKARRRTMVLDFKHHPPVLNYLTSPILKENSLGELYFLEVSVFDSGIGFVDKFKSLNPSTQLTDAEIVKTCMIKHNTSAKGLGKDDKGIGLDRVLHTLNLKGFLLISTGRLRLYRDLISNRYLELEKGDVSKMELFDWQKNSNTKYNRYPNVSGSVITILYPLATNE